MPDDNLKNKLVLITGGGSGIGLAAAKLFLREGARVVIMGRNQEKLVQAAQSLEGGDRLMWQGADAAESSQVLKVVEQIHAANGPIDILVNNAGANIKERTIRELTPSVGAISSVLIWTAPIIAFMPFCPIWCCDTPD